MATENTKKTNDIAGNIDLGYSTKKKNFSVGGDINNIVEFDPSDLGVANRLSKSLSKFKDFENQWEELNKSAENLQESDDMELALKNTEDFSAKFDKLEKDVRELIDYVFDAEIADALLGNSSSFSPVNGYFKYEHIITAMLNCFEQNVKDEAPKFNKRNVQKHTNKYLRK